jgi:hypothetical protein
MSYNTINETTPLVSNARSGQTSAEVIESNSQYLDLLKEDKKESNLKRSAIRYGFIALVVIVSLRLMLNHSTAVHDIILGAAWSSQASPLSIEDPVHLGIIQVDRPYDSRPSKAFGELLDKGIPLPTNTWYENFVLGSDNTVAESNVFQVPYILDTSGHLTGLRTHACHVQASAKTVMVSYAALPLSIIYYPQ